MKKSHDYLRGGMDASSFGTQIIRTAAMLQLLLGNVGELARSERLARHSNIQGARTWRACLTVCGLSESAESGG